MDLIGLGQVELEGYIIDLSRNCERTDVLRVEFSHSYRELQALSRQ